MLAVVGTIPDRECPIIDGKVRLDGDRLHIGDRFFPVNRGTPALLAAAVKAGEVLGVPSPFSYLAGDIGLGDGSRRLYDVLTRRFGNAGFHTITFHYLQPDVDWHARVMFAIDEMAPRPFLIADAGFMYAAKMSGQASAYDLFTPDVGELAFLADEQAPHPFYTRGFILQDEHRAPELIARAYEHDNAARFLLVKGSTDLVADQKGIKASIQNYPEKAMEAIGGTGDTLTGMVSVLIDAGMDVLKAATLAAQANRLAGRYAAPTPATQVAEIIRHIPRALEKLL
jgi:hypothetical protein